MKKILILGASVLQTPAIKKAKDLGFWVGVIDFNNKAPGIKYADEYFNISTNDIDKVVQVAKEFNPDGITTLATDMPIRSVAAVCEELGLTGISSEVAINVTDKGKMMNVFEANSISHPWYYIISSEDDLSQERVDIEYPCIIKPTDNSGSRGVILVNSKRELHKAFKYSRKHSRSGQVIVQEYLRGEEVSVEIIVVNGKPHILAVTDKITSGVPHFVELGHSQPSSLSKAKIKSLNNLAIKAVIAMKINTGAVHVEIMDTNKGPVIIEIGARMGGDNIATHLVPMSTGIDMVKAVLLQACNESFDIIPKYSKSSIIKYFNSDFGMIIEIKGVEEAKKICGVEEVSLLKEVGDKVNSINSSTDRLGFIIAQSDDISMAFRKCDKAIKQIEIKTMKIFRSQKAC